MNIKKIVKLGFLLITILVIFIAAINSIVLYQIKDNEFSKKKIARLVSMQEGMNSLSKDLVGAKSLEILDSIKAKFIGYEKEFEETKKIFSHSSKDNILDKDHILDRVIGDLHTDPLIDKDLKLLYENEKDIEIAFDKAYDLQEEKVLLIKKFDEDYPLENKMRKTIEEKIVDSKKFQLMQIFGDLQYHSKETLYQKRDKETLDKWLGNIYHLQKEHLDIGLEKYIDIVKEVAGYTIRMKEIETLEEQLTGEILNIVSLNREVNLNIEQNIDKISSNFTDKIYSYVLILLGFTIFIIALVAYRVSKNVGMTVDEIEMKVESGLEEIKSLNREIVSTQHEVIFTMGAIGEQRSKETGNHVKRVAQYSKILALYYGLNEDESEMLKQVSPMHDIGKVAIPDAVLNKPGRFDEKERKIMNTHADLGHDMLKSSNRPLLKLAAIVAYEHHEKWDGSGYPRGLSGEAIHICGRITALADVFDALGSDRVYKRAWDDERIFNLFKEERGKHFDPRLIDIFFEHLDEFLKIRNSLRDTMG